MVAVKTDHVSGEMKGVKYVEGERGALVFLCLYVAVDLLVEEESFLCLWSFQGVSEEEEENKNICLAYTVSDCM